MSGGNAPHITNYEPPGLTLPVYELDHAVFSCEQAAAAKQIPLEYELTTMVLETTAGIHAVHVPGNERVCLRAVKRALRCDQAYLASPDFLRMLGLASGIVCPVLDPVWSFPHLLSATVLGLEFVSTNNGTLSNFFRFPPQLLLGAREVMVGRFES